MLRHTWANPVWPGFIVFEGIDGSGTTTQAQRLVEFLRQRGDAEYTCEPTRFATGVALRTLLAGREPSHPQTLAMLFATDRHEHLERPGTGIRARLAAGCTVVSDRYLFSSLAYQGLENDPAYVESLNAGFPLPEHLIYLRLDPTTAAARLAGRTELDEYERIDFQLRVAQRYDEVIAAFEPTATHIHTIDGSPPPEQVFGAIIAALGLR